MILAVFLFFAPAARAGDMKDEIRADKVDYFLNAAFARNGLNPMRDIGLERNAVVFRIRKLPKDQSQTGIYSHFSLAGDFEFLADYEVVNLAKPSTGYGMSLGMAVHTLGKQGAVFLTRSHHADWNNCHIATRETPGENGEKNYDGEPYPTATRKGRMGFRRVGDQLILLAGERNAELVELKRIPFTAEPINQIRFYADTGGADLPVEGRFTNILIRADSINGAAIPPNTAWHWTTYLLLASLGLGIVYIVLFLRRRRRNRELYEE